MSLTVIEKRFMLIALELVKTFKTFDKDKDESITLEEMVTGLRSFDLSNAIRP
jgi:Ca2+-binding EF-hand superfamily protein